MVTAHSEYGQLLSVYIKSPETAFRSQQSLDNQWQEHRFLTAPDFSKAVNEHSDFRRMLELSGTQIKTFPADETVSIDSLYCRDASIHTDFGVILCAMGKPLRRNEPAACERQYVASGERILGAIEAPGTVEGGDLAWLDNRTLAVGHGYRTNAEGIRQLRAFLEPYGITIIEVDLPHYHGPSDVFHLMSILSPVDRNLAVVYSPLMSVRFRNHLMDRGFRLVEVPDQEFDSLGCNVLAVAPRKCLVEKNNQVTIARLREAGCEVTPFDGTHMCVPGGGGPTCLTRPVLRSIPD